MKTETHPEYFQVQATCVCGNVILTGSTKSAIKMDICSACHPFFTGTQKIVDTEGRVEKFKKRYSNQTAAPKKEKAEKQEQPKAEVETVEASTEAIEPAVEETPAEPIAEAAAETPAE